MTFATAAIRPPRQVARGGLLYRIVWRWHFLAALYVLPFLFVMSASGGLYLLKPRIDGFLYADRLHVAAEGAWQPLDAQVMALHEAEGISRLHGVLVSDDPNRSVRIDFNDPFGVRSYAWIDPYTLDLLGVSARDTMPTELLRRLHGELLMGETGALLIELAAHWSLVLFATGVILWWPRGARRLRDAIALPRGKGRAWWRQGHLFVGMLATLLTVPLLLTSLPMTPIWGGALSRVQESTAQAPRSLEAGTPIPASLPMGRAPIGLEAALHTAIHAEIPPPWEVRPSPDAAGPYIIASASTDRTQQGEIALDKYTGALLSRLDFADDPPVARAVEQAVAFHQGELYGKPNRYQNALAAFLGMLLSVSGFVVWWMRRPAGSLGVPQAPDLPVGTGMIALAIGLMVLLPLVGASLALALALDRLLIRQLGRLRARPAPSRL
ncbi:PepSY-associated TM helix domain-containing protein [Pontivivens ytuae]|uniref:PepSY domain-containing protein n=1 Tax=Pontivivens ytuae TaxID=2789856 RepID=A0A7S9QD23_9RHOB|nr:PepSY domain-containing protein [Pontivivens ytuae]QPH54440.1 PepSY domain-containing protein [Pontivivens ytuae]